jgi:hypothetical protein
MRMSDTFAALSAALVAAQRDMPAVGRDGVNPAYRSRYMTLDGILAAVIPTLTRNGIAVVQSAAIGITDEDGRPITITVATRLIHASGEWLENTAIVPITKPDAHGVGSATTYGRRFSLAAMLGIMAEEYDDDGNQAVGPRPVAPPQRLRPVGREEVRDDR